MGTGAREMSLANLLIGLSCFAMAIALAQFGRRFAPGGHRRYLAFASFVGVTGAFHALDGVGLFHLNQYFKEALTTMCAGCAVGVSFVARSFVKRIGALTSAEHAAQQREGDLTAVLAELSKAYSRLQDQAALKTQVFANVSHELRTPLTLILGPTQELRQSPDLDEQQRASLMVVERNAQLLLGHVNDLLELSRADVVGITLRPEPTDVGRLLRTLASNFRSLAIDLGIEYQVELGPELASRLVDPGKLERIIVNLLANAFKFTPRGGKVALAARIEESPERDGGAPFMSIAVDDSGPGIRPEDRERVFERFRQLDSRPNRSFSGTGLGLSIVREFVTAVAGTVRIEDSSLGGARFVVHIPADVAEDGEHDPDSFPVSLGSAEMLALRPRPSLVSDPEHERMTPVDLPLVLVVEDNPDMNRFLVSSLSTEFHVTSAFDGEQALTRLEALIPDLIVTDFMMPRMSGDEFVRELRARPALIDVPVLVLTARDDVELRVRVLSEGVQDWVTKPFTVRELLARARNLISARRARAILRHELTTREFDVGELAEQLAERKRRLESLLDSLTQALDQAELASRFKTSLLRLVSHELRTPLGALQLQMERLSGEHRGPLNEAQQQLVTRMRRSLARLTDTIQSLLEYARIESGRLELFVETFDPSEVARGVVDDFTHQAEAKGLRIELRVPDGPTTFESDCRLLRLVLVNLVANALKFTTEGHVSVVLEVDEDRCQLQVRDTGPGIEPSMREAVFEPFFQGESTTYQPQSQGAGLGLSLVKEMLLALGGNITLESEVGAGSTFRISVPRAVLPRSETQRTALARETA